MTFYHAKYDFLLVNVAVAKLLLFACTLYVVYTIDGARQSTFNIKRHSISGKIANLKPTGIKNHFSEGKIQKMK